MSRRRVRSKTYVKLLLFALLGHVCLISLGITDFIKAISDNLDDALFTLILAGSHVHIYVQATGVHVLNDR